MIKLELAPKPKKLTKKFQKEKTDYFIATGKPVWNIEWLKDAIFKMSYGKCCYSEVRLGEEGKYMEVEHFIPKSVEPKLVMEWGNLLPSCKKCNGVKREHNTKIHPIVNPFKDNPKDYFFIKNFRFYPKGDKREIAERTIDVVGLNDRQHLVEPRFKIGNNILDIISSLNANKNDVLNEKRRREYFRKLNGIMRQGLKKEEYAALVSTVILTDGNFIEIEAFLKNNDLWYDELEELKKELEFCSLPE